jgi:transcriptional regulator with XRE-family HTH domain
VIKRPPEVKKKHWKLGRHMQKIRQSKDVTQEELAERISVTTSWVGQIETGRVVPSLKLLGKIARALDVKVKDLIPY